jgi:hypothetical protein
MTMQRIGSLVLTLLAGLLSLAVMLFGIGAALSIDFHFNPILSVLYCALPILSFPVFFFALRHRKLAALEAVLAIAYLAVYSALNRRACGSLGYCGSVASTVLLTLRTRSVLAYFLAAIFAPAGLALREGKSFQRYH